MTDEINAIEGKLVQSIEAKELGSLTADYAELGLDALLDDGLAKDIPIVGTLIKAAKVGLNVRDRIYAKKIIGFLVQVGQTTQEQRDEFVRKHCDNVKRFEETVLLILEQADRFEKTSLVGKIFRACILGEISYGEALRLSGMVNRAFWGDIQEIIETGDIKNKKSNQTIDVGGFYHIKGGNANSIYGKGSNSIYGSSSLDYELNEYGKMLVKIANQ